MHYETTTTDDDTTLSQYLRHLWCKEKGTKNHGELLRIDISKPQWFVDPTHRVKCVAGVFFEMIKGPV